MISPHMTKKRGIFITFEGLDGCGKSTQLERLAAELRSEGIDVLTTREPGGTAIGERIRSILLDSATSGLTPMAELALMFASRAQQLEELIVPTLERGTWVLCDRFTDSSEAYQGGGRELGSQTVLDLHRVVCRNVWPDFTVLMDSEVEASVARARRRNLKKTDAANENRFETEDRTFFERVHEAYRVIAKREKQRVLMLDARRPADVVHPQIVAAVRERFLANSTRANKRAAKAKI
jgi:dTMP kinase